MKRLLYTVLASLLLIMTVPTTTAQASSADHLINVGKKYMGIKYRYGGTTPAGFDCSGYTQYVFREAGVSIPRTTGSQFGTGKAVSKSNLKTGDLVFFNTSGRGVSHVGIFIQGGKFIHASTSQGVTITALNDPYYWGKRYIGARRVKDFTPQVAAPAQQAPAKVEPTVTRAEVANVLTERLDLQASTEAPFADVSSSHPHAASIAAVAEAGIFGGVPGTNNFNPNNKLTRAQAAKVLVNAYGLEGKSGLTFTDVNGYNEHIDILATNGITTGIKQADGSVAFNPNATLSEKHFMTFIERIENKLK